MFKLGRACNAIRYIKPFMFQDMLGIIYCSYFHFILSYGVILWGNSAYSSNIFKIQKGYLRVIMNPRNRDSCHQLLKKLKILSLKSWYIFSLLLFIAKNRDLYKSDSEISTPDLVLTYILQLQSKQHSKRDPSVLESKFLITFLLALKIHPMT